MHNYAEGKDQTNIISRSIASETMLGIDLPAAIDEVFEIVEIRLGVEKHSGFDDPERLGDSCGEDASFEAGINDCPHLRLIFFKIVDFSELIP